MTAKKIPSLDGLRALSILLVVLSHCLHGVSAQHGPRRVLYAVAYNGSIGVSIFFVISGFLITTLLLREKNSTGRISLSGFYLRRVFRILPAFFVFMASLVLANRLHLLPAIPASQFLHALTFTADYQRYPNDLIGHIWSLSVE